VVEWIWRYPVKSAQGESGHPRAWRRAADGGRGTEAKAVWSLPELQDLLDQWLVIWQSRPHDGLRDPLHPGRAFSPDEKYAALTETAGYVPLALSPDDYIELLPATWRP
jgi:putative transposase